MNTVEFRCKTERLPLQGRFLEIETISIFVDGQSLVQWVRKAERPLAENPKLAGAYIGVSTAWIGPGILPYFLGQGADALGYADPADAQDRGKTPLLSCKGCGEVGCWPFLARITVDDDTVTWSEFEQPRRPGWRYEGLGPFVFARKQYEAALLKLGNQS